MENGLLQPLSIRQWYDRGIPYLLGVGYLYIKTGSLNMVNQRSHCFGRRLERIRQHKFLVLVCLGFDPRWPLHAWLPNAYCTPMATSPARAPGHQGDDLRDDPDGPYGLWSGFFIRVNPAFGTSLVGRGRHRFGRSNGLGSAGDRDVAYLIVAEVGYMVGAFGFSIITE